MSGIDAARVPATTLVWFSTSLEPSPYAYQRWIAPLAPSYSSTSRLPASVTNTVVVPLTVLVLRRPCASAVACGVAGAAGRGQPVLGIVAEGEGAVGGEVAVGIIDGAHCAHSGVSVE